MDLVIEYCGNTQNKIIISPKRGKLIIKLKNGFTEELEDLAIKIGEALCAIDFSGFPTLTSNFSTFDKRLCFRSVVPKEGIYQRKGYKVRGHLTLDSTNKVMVFNFKDPSKKSVSSII